MIRWNCRFQYEGRIRFSIRHITTFQSICYFPCSHNNTLFHSRTSAHTIDTVATSSSSRERGYCARTRRFYGAGPILTTTAKIRFSRRRTRRTSSPIMADLSLHLSTMKDDKNVADSSINEKSGSFSNEVRVRDAWIQLKHRFDTLVNDDGLFPLMTEKEQVQMDNLIAEKDSQKRASVLVLLCTINKQPSIIFTRRARTMNSHAAEISFPGGQYDDQTDTNDIDTAIRETIEELVPTTPTDTFRNDIRILGQTTLIPSLKGLPVRAIVAVYWNDMNTTITTNNCNDPSNTGNVSIVNELQDYFTGNVDEVDAIFSIPIQELYNTESIYPIHETNRFGLRHTPMYPSMKYGNIWGLTAFILKPLLHHLFGPVFFLLEQQSK